MTYTATKNITPKPALMSGSVDLTVANTGVEMFKTTLGTTGLLKDNLPTDDNDNEYGSNYPTQSQQVKNKAKKTRFKRYGDENYNNREKCVETTLERYGTKNVFQNEDIKEKSKQTKIKKYGDENYSNFEATKRTNLKRYGVEYSCLNEKVIKKKEQTNLKKYGFKSNLTSKDTRDKFRKTNLERYGVEYPLQRPDIHEKQQKTSYKYKEHTTPSGNTIKLQGYEPQAYDMLIEKYDEKDIINENKNIPEIWYKTSDDIRHRYFPDFFIPKDNLIVEVKSAYTYQANLEVNLLKQQACLDEGYNFNFMILEK